MKRMILIAFLFSIALGAVSCSISLAPPNGYVELDDPPMYDYVAFSPDDVRISVKKQENLEHGNIDFWYKTFMNLNVTNRGRKFIKDGDFSAKNKAGKYLVFESETNGIVHLYVVGVLPIGEDKDDDIFIIEAAGKKEKMESDLDAIIASFNTLK